jgi:hypothetical protein
MLQVDPPQRQLLDDASKRAALNVESEAAAIRRNPEPFLREALALRP